MNVQFIKLDIYDDPNLEIIKEIVNTTNCRDSFAKCASQVNLHNEESLERLRDDQYALVLMDKTGNVSKKYPIDSLEQTWLSSIYFMKTGAQLPNLAQAIAASNIKHAANVWGLETPDTITKIASNYPFSHNIWVEGQQEDIDLELKTPENMEKIARDPDSNDNRYWGLSNGYLRYPLHNQEQIKVAAEYLQQNEKAFTPEERHEFATKIAARGHEYGMIEQIQKPVLTKYAGPGMGFGDELKAHLKKRQTFNEIDELEEEPLEKTSFQKLSNYGFGDRFMDNITRRQELANDLHLDSREYEELVKSAATMGTAKTAQALIHVDKRTGLSRYWDKSIDDPFAAVYGKYHIKSAQEHIMFGDQMLTKSDLLSISSKDFTVRFGESAWNEFQRNPLMIFQSMPTPEQSVIASMIKNPTYAEPIDY
jgi:hypothetical protein